MHQSRNKCQSSRLAPIQCTDVPISDLCHATGKPSTVTHNRAADIKRDRCCSDPPHDLFRPSARSLLDPWKDQRTSQKQNGLILHVNLEHSPFIPTSWLPPRTRRRSKTCALRVTSEHHFPETRRYGWIAWVHLNQQNGLDVGTVRASIWI